MAKFDTVDTYIASFPPDVQAKLEAVRATMRAAAVGTRERISYGIPTFALGDDYVAYFAGWRTYISVYPVPHGDAALDRDIAAYKAGRGTLRFPLDQDLPLELIARVTTRLLEQRRSRQS
jgi:uncharacterized protein YdhG (YjbR/CyaY superfamily)